MVEVRWWVVWWGSGDGVVGGGRCEVGWWFSWFSWDWGGAAVARPARTIVGGRRLVAPRQKAVCRPIVEPKAILARRKRRRLEKPPGRRFVGPWPRQTRAGWPSRAHSVQHLPAVRRQGRGSALTGTSQSPRGLGAVAEAFEGKHRSRASKRACATRATRYGRASPGGPVRRGADCEPAWLAGPRSRTGSPPTEVWPTWPFARPAPDRWLDACAWERQSCDGGV